MTVRRYTLDDVPRGLDLRRSFAFNRRPGERNNRGRVPVIGLSAAPPSPAQIITDGTLKIWLQGDLLASTSTSAFDSIGNGGDAAVLASITQGTAARRPKTSTIRTRQGLFFVSSSQLSMTGAMTGSPVCSNAAGYTEIRVGRSSSTGTVTHLATNSPSANANFLQSTGTTWPRNLVMSAGTTRTATGVITEDEVCTEEAFFQGASSTLRKNSAVLLTAGNAGANNFAGTLFWGSSANATAYITGQEYAYIVVARAITPAERTAIENWFSYCIDHTGTQWDVLPLGDSLTDGLNSTDGNGYRSYLSAYLANNKVNSKWLYMVGDVRDLAFPDDKHHGVSGDPIANTQAWVNANMGVGLPYNPRIVLLRIGTNNARNNGAVYVSGTGVGTTNQEYIDLVASIDAKVFAAKGFHPKICATTIPDCHPSQTTTRTNINDFNANLASAWSSLASSGVDLHTEWDCRNRVGDWDSSTYGADFIHYNDGGYGGGDIAGVQATLQAAA